MTTTEWVPGFIFCEPDHMKPTFTFFLLVLHRPRRQDQLN